MQWILVMIAAVILYFGSPSITLAQESNFSANENATDSETMLTTSNENESSASVIILHNDEKVDLDATLNSNSLEKILTLPGKSVSNHEVQTTIPTTSEGEVKVEKVAEVLTTETKEKEKTNPILNVNLLGLNISLLDEDSLISLSSNDTDSLLSVEVIDKIGIDVLSQKEERKGSLATINVDSNTLGKINAELLSFEREQGTYQYTGAVANVDIQDSLLKSVTGDINVSLLKKNENRKGVLGVDIRHSDLLGDIGLDVISAKSEESEFAQIEETKLLGLHLNNFLIGENDLNVLNNKTEIVGDKKHTQSTLLNANLKIVGENNISLIDINKEQSPKLTKTHSGLLSVQLNNSLLGNVDSTILESEYVSNEKENSIGNGKSKDEPTNQSSIRLIGNNKTNQPIISLISRNNNISEKDDWEFIGSEFQPFDPIHTIIESSLTENELNNVEHKENMNDKTVRDQINEWIELGKEIIANEMNSIIQNINDSKDTRFQVIERIQNLPSQSEITTNHNNHSQSSHSTTANVFDGQSKIAGYVLNEIIRNEVNKSKLKWQQNNLSNQWIKPPPWKPPIQNSFFTK